MIAMLAEGHHGVKLSPEELASIALWIDLAVPFVGDYSEMNVWNEQEAAIYRRFLDKKLKSEASERENIAALVRHLGGEDVHAEQLHPEPQSDSRQSASRAEGRGP
jgi:hypothetical protein